MNTMSVATLGGAVRHARQEQGLTQAQLAVRAGVGRRFIIDLEAGHTRAELGKTLLVMRVLGLQLDAVSAPVSVAEAPDGTVSFTTVAGHGGRPVFVPTRLWRLPDQRAQATVQLPRSVYWSGGNDTFDLADEQDRQLAYRILLTEATPDVMVQFIDGDLLTRMWDSMLLPADLRAAWQPVVDDYQHVQAA